MNLTGNLKEKEACLFPPLPAHFCFRFLRELFPRCSFSANGKKISQWFYDISAHLWATTKL